MHRKYVLCVLCVENMYYAYYGPPPLPPPSAHPPQARAKREETKRAQAQDPGPPSQTKRVRPRTLGPNRQYNRQYNRQLTNMLKITQNNKGNFMHSYHNFSLVNQKRMLEVFVHTNFSIRVFWERRDM